VQVGRWLCLVKVVRRPLRVAAVFEGDVVDVLKGLGLYEQLVEGKLRCFICDEVVSLSTLGGLLKVGGRVRVVCNKPRCLWEASKVSAALQGESPFGT